VRTHGRSGFCIVTNAGALSHIRVLDLTRVLAGPWATQILGDLGAEVIKVERPGCGDEARDWGPPYLSGTDLSAYYLCANRNKKSIAVDLSQPEGADIVRRLASQCDVLVENFKVGGLKQYALDYDSLRSSDPRLIYCSITGFGQTGPEAQRSGYDAMIQAMGGLMSVTGRAAGEPGEGPQKVGVAIVDVMTGLYATIAVLAALQHRARSGVGQYIDMALLDVQVACLANQAMNFLTAGESPPRLGNAHPSIVPYQDFATADGNVMLAVGNNEQFARFCSVAGHPEWATDARFSSNRARVEHRYALVVMIGEVTRTQSTQFWLRALQAAAVPCGPINTIAEMFREPQVRARGLHVEMADAQGRAMPLVASPLRLSESPVSYDRAPPTLGQDTRSVLRSLLHLTDDKLKALQLRGILEER
jgi:crotonobetainyl-CoA:carnitine CoA-transferase CaiB-like acyl-CoA transferase